MSFPELFAIAVALAMDAFAVSACAATSLERVRWYHYGKLSGAFGSFQFFMPVIGWYLGATVRSYIEAWDHWIAFALLGWIGLSMIRSGWSAVKQKAASECCNPSGNTGERHADPTSFGRLMMLAVATSIDALAVGLSFAMLGMDILWPAALIGVVCAVITAIGLLIGTCLARANVFGSRVEAVGGLVLVGIGIKILCEHQVF